MREADGASTLDEAEIGRIFRQESGRAVATLIRVLGDIDIAEDAVQEAFAVAQQRWPSAGLPPNPGGWITTTARNRAIDRLRRESRERELVGELTARTADPDLPEEVGLVRDDRLRLIFTCCHPALSTEAQVALTLRLLGGLTTAEVAHSFLVSRRPGVATQLAFHAALYSAANGIPEKAPLDRGRSARSGRFRDDHRRGRERGAGNYGEFKTGSQFITFRTGRVRRAIR